MLDVHHRAMREALKKHIPLNKLQIVLPDCGLSQEEIVCVMEYCDLANRTWVAGTLHVSDRTVDRICRRALDKLCTELSE